MEIKDSMVSQDFMVVSWFKNAYMTRSDTDKWFQKRLVKSSKTSMSDVSEMEKDARERERGEERRGEERDPIIDQFIDLSWISKMPFAMHIPTSLLYKQFSLQGYIVYRKFWGQNVK